MSDILFKTDDFVFSYRAAGILIKDDKILLQKPLNDDYAFIGGHVSALETTEKALKREFKEEIHADICIDRLFAVGEIFFPWGKRPCHQISLYYKIHLQDDNQIPRDGIFKG
ncbi:MAG: NUDIX hydrolase, partial [Candidatus Ornithomonoglobus sp.]